MIQFGLSESPENGWLRLTLYGELDLLAAPLLRQRLEELQSANRPMLLDLSQLEFLDCSGLEALIWAIGAAASLGWRVRIDPRLAPQPQRLVDLVTSDFMATNQPSYAPPSAA